MKEIVMNENISKQRNSSIELLRIIAMIMITASHFVSHGGFSFAQTTLSIPRFWCNLLEGSYGTSLFVLISGYFLIKSTESVFNIKKILRFWGEIIFYSIAIYLVAVIAGIIEWGGAKALIKTCFPITFGSWWFASTYFVLYLIHPFLNMLLRRLDKSIYQKLLVLLLIIWCLIPTFTSSSYESNNLLWFMTLYAVAGYVRLFNLNPKFKRKHYLIFWLIVSSLRYLSTVVLTLIGTHVTYVANHIQTFYGRQSLLTLLSALSLFMIFEKTDIRYSKIINNIASATFGIYLIHDSNIIRPILWDGIFHNAQYQDSILIIPYSIMAVVIIFVVCTIIDLLRQKFIEKPFVKLVNKYADSWIKPFEKIIDAGKKALFGKENK